MPRLAAPACIGRSRSADDLVRVQARTLHHNALTDLLLGGVARGVRLRDEQFPGPGGEVRVRIYEPEAASAPRPLVVNFHGGGWITGDLEQADWLCSNVASGAGATVVSVRYRLAPTHRFPAAAEDCYAAVVWAAEHATDLGADGARLGVMGESAGGNLAAVVCLMARDRSGPTIRHQALLYPATDLTLSSPSIARMPVEPILTAADIVAFRDHYLGPDGPADDPRASPLLADDHVGLPPALVQVADHDPIRDDGVRYANALRAAGVDVRLTEYVRSPHGYLNFPRICGASHHALAEICAEITRAG
jgi:acetyl esterase